MKNYLFIISISLLLFSACERNNTVEYEYVEGTIKYCGLDCCEGWTIYIEKHIYYPENLPEEFQIEDLEVLVAYDKTDDIRNCNFGGNAPIIKILDIKRL